MILKRLLGDIMIDMGFVTTHQLNEALKRQREIFEEKKLPELLHRAQLVAESQLSLDESPLLGQILMDMGFVSEEQLEEALNNPSKMEQALLNNL